jgi:hypothetical protein
LHRLRISRVGARPAGKPVWLLIALLLALFMP